MFALTDNEEKKSALFEVFRAAVWASLVGSEEVEAAITKAENLGLTMEEFGEVVEKWDAKQFAAYFGENAIGRDLVNAMKAVDIVTSSVDNVYGYPPLTEYATKGFYSKNT